MDTPLEVIRENYYELSDLGTSLAAVKLINEDRDSLVGIDDLKKFTKVLRHLVLDKNIDDLVSMFGSREYIVDLIDYVVTRINNLEETFNRDADIKLEVHLFVDSLKLFHKSLMIDPLQLKNDSKVRLIIENAFRTKQKISKLTNPADRLVDDFHLSDEVISIVEHIEDDYLPHCNGKLYSYIHGRYLDFILYQQKVLREYPLHLIDAHYVRGNRDGMRFLNYAMKRSINTANRLSESINKINIPRKIERVQFANLIAQKCLISTYALGAHLNYYSIVGILKTIDIEFDSIALVDNLEHLENVHNILDDMFKNVPAFKSTGGMADMLPLLQKVTTNLTQAFTRYTEKDNPDATIISDLQNRLATVERIKSTYNPVGKHAKTKKKKR